jgi:hypothetical protein
MRIAVALLLVAACDGPESTGTTCPEDPFTLAYTMDDTPQCMGPDCGFGKTFMDMYCISCHDHDLPRSQRHGAPLFHDFDSLLGVMKTPEHIDQQAGIGPDASNHWMPPDRCPSIPGGDLDIDCPQPTDEERTKLAQWLACEKLREHNF